jgi:hypothetical protein
LKCVFSLILNETHRLGNPRDLPEDETLSNVGAIKFPASMKSRLALLVLLLSLPVSAQTTSSAPTAAQATVSFGFQWNQGIPWTNYSVQVEADGKTHFKGIPNSSQGGEMDPVEEDFVMSAANLQEIFDSARKLNYFRGDLDSHLKHIAQTGIKTLEYRSAEVHGSSSYNYSQNPTVQRLTQLFLGLATTLDYGRKLAWQYRYDKLGLDQELRELEQLQAGHQLEELSLLEPILRKMLDDPNLMHITRQSAERLLKAMGAPGPAPPSAAQP